MAFLILTGLFAFTLGLLIGHTLAAGEDATLPARGYRPPADREPPVKPPPKPSDARASSQPPPGTEFLPLSEFSLPTKGWHRITEADPQRIGATMLGASLTAKLDLLLIAYRDEFLAQCHADGMSDEEACDCLADFERDTLHDAE